MIVLVTTDSSLWRVKHGKSSEQTIEIMDAEQALAYLFGMSLLEPVMAQPLRGIKVKIDLDTSAGPGERYRIEIDGRDIELAASWVIPFMAGMAVRHESDFELTEQGSERRRRMQALMIGHQRGWLTYIEIIEGKRS